MTHVGLESPSERSGGEALALHLSQRINLKLAVLSLTGEERLWIMETSPAKMTRSHGERAEFKSK